MKNKIKNPHRLHKGLFIRAYINCYGIVCIHTVKIESKPFKEDGSYKIYGRMLHGETNWKHIRERTIYINDLMFGRTKALYQFSHKLLNKLNRMNAQQLFEVLNGRISDKRWQDQLLQWEMNKRLDQSF